MVVPPGQLVVPIAQVDEDALDDFLLRLVSTDSLSTQEGAAAEVLCTELERLGFAVEVDQLGSVIGRLELGRGPTVMLDCHLDTVPVVDRAEWTRNPGGEVVDGRLYGRGAVDMKGPMAACVHGIAALRGLGTGTIVVAGTVAEELVEGPASVHVAKAVGPDFVVICEPSQRRVARGQRGRAEIVVEVDGIAAHSAYPDSGINAAQVMVDVLRALRDWSPPSDPVLGEGILVLIDVKSEPYPSLSTVPVRCRATFDRRLLIGEDEEQVLAPVRAVLEEVATRWGTTGTARIAADDFVSYTGEAVHAPNFAPAWLFGEDEPVIERAVTGLRRAGLDAEVTNYRFCTNGSGTAGHLGIPTLGYGPGNEDQAHTVDEWIALSEVHLGARGYAAIVAGLITAGISG